MRSYHFPAALTLSLILSACAHTPAGNAQAELDPLQGVNRAVYGFNKGVDTVVIRPATVVYRHTVPTAGRRGIANAFNNVDEPFSFINALLQGKPKQAMRTFARFAINTVLGVGGLADHATDMGLPEEKEDFGQTLAVWGVNSGPYLVLPLLGPSTLRDAVGRGVEFLGGDPYRHLPNAIGLTQTQRYALSGVEIVDTRSYFMDTADKLVGGSADEYATIRSAYLQQRLDLIYDGAPPEEIEPSIIPNGMSARDISSQTTETPSVAEPTPDQPITVQQSQ